MVIIPCNHERLHLGSGDYYVFCLDCRAAWMRMSRHARPEYGMDKDGKMVGADPQAANQPGFVSDGMIRQAVPI